MKRLLLSFVAISGLVLLGINSLMGQVVVQNITYSHASPPYTVDVINSFVPPCGGTTGTLTIGLVTSSMPAGTVYTIGAQSSLGYNNINGQTTVSAGQLIQQSYSGLAGSATGVFYTIVIRTPKVPPTFNDSTYLAVINLRVFSTNNFRASVIPVNPLCPVPPNKGSASVSISSGTAPYTYVWSTTPNPGNSPSAPNLDPGSYSVSVTDAAGCDTIMPFTIVVDEPTVSLSSIPNPICNPTFPLNITWTATPGAGWTPNPAGAYSWDNGLTFITSNTFTQSGIMTYGTYPKSVIFKDINNCLSPEVTLAVPVDSKPQVTAVANPTSVCPGLTSDITATLVPPCSSIGGTCQFSYDNGTTFTGSSSYTTPPINRDTTIMVRVRNSTGCLSDPFPVAIDTSGKPRVIPVVSPSPICPNAAYSITATCANNCTGAQISFNGGPFVGGSPQTFNQPVAPLVASTTSFPVSAIGVNGCQFDTTVTVVVFTNTLTINNPSTPICANNNGSSVTLTATGFMAATTVTWSSTPSGLPGDGATTTSIVASSPNSGSISYTVSGTDVNGCPRTTNTSITVNPQPTAMLTGPSIHCEGTTSVLTASGGATYQWYNSTFTTLLSPSGSTFNVSPTATTTYGVIATDANGCRDSATFVLNYRARPTGSASLSSPTICAGNTTNVTITANLPFTPNASGGYSINDGISYSGTSASPFTFIAVGPFSTTTTINTRLRDDAGCASATIPVTITVLPFTASITGANASCSYSANGQGTLTVSGGTPNYEYSVDIAGGPFTSFAGTSTTISGLTAGTPHVVYVRDNGNACNTTANVTVTTPPELILTMTTANDVRCKGETNGSIVVDVTGGTATYDLYLNTIGSPVFSNVSAGSQTYSNLAGGVSGALTYDLIVEDNNGCRDTVVNVPVNEPATALVAPGTSSVNACFGTATGSISIPSASTGGWGGYVYTKTTAPTQTLTIPASITSLAAGTYNFSVADTRGCTVTFSQVVGQFSQIVLSATVVSPDCNNASGSLTVNGASGGVSPYTFTNNGSPYTAGTPIGSLSAGNTILIHVVDSSPNGCNIDSTFTIYNLPRSMPIVTVTPPTCPGGDDGFVVFDSVRVKNTSGAPFTFDMFTDASPIVQVGTVTLPTAVSSGTVSGLLGGTYIMNITDITCPNYPVDSFVLFTAPSTFTVVKAPYAGTNPGYAELVVPQPSPFTTSSIALASDINQNTGTVILYNLQGGTPFAGPAYQLSIDNPTALTSVTLRDTLGGQKYAAFTNLAPGPHTVYIRDANGCSDTILIQIPGKFFIPNLVTPNQDDANDVFEVVSLPDNSELRLYNRWGDRVFESSNYDNKYDFKGLSDGVYYYDLEFNTGTRFKGWVQVLR